MGKKINLIYGVGYNPHERVIDSKGKVLRSYTSWLDMIKRCYSVSFKGKNPTYIDCTVCDEWLHYSEFIAWFDKNYISGYQLDKDILVNGNKIYSPETCVFIPKKINTLLSTRSGSKGDYPTGVYYDKRRNRIMAQISIYGAMRFLGRFDCEKKAHSAYVYAKKEYVKEVSSTYFLDGLICSRVFCALNKWSDNLK